MKKSTKLLFTMVLIMCFVMSASAAGHKTVIEHNADSCVQNDGLVPQYCDQVILMDFARKHNIASLVAATGKDRLIYPEGCATVTVDGEEVLIVSVEAFADGRLYIFVEDLLEEDMDVEVTFINPTDEAYRIVYIDGDQSVMPDYDGPAYPNKYVGSDLFVPVVFHCLIYMLDGMVYDIDFVALGEEVVQKEAPLKEGYIFSGWSEIPEIMPDYDVIVTGSFEVDGIKAVVTNQLVDVYTRQGVMVKRQIPMEKLSNELPTGIYIINGEKMIIH